MMARRKSRNDAVADADKTALRLLEIVQQVVAELRPYVVGRPLTFDTSLDRDIGLDSLGRIELLARLERDFKVVLPGQAFASAETPRDFLRMVMAAGGARAAVEAIEVSEIGLGDVESPPAGAQTLVDVLDWHVKAHPTRPHVWLYQPAGAVVSDLIGTTPDDIVFAPPHTVLKTSSGKIRRAASRQLYENRRIGMMPRTVWWQVVRLVVGGFRPELRRMRHGLADGFYAIYALTVFALMAPLVWVSVVLLPRLSWRWGFMRVAAKLLARLTGTKLTVRGWEHLPPPEQPCVFVANHESYLDGYVLVETLPRTFRFVAKVEFRHRLLPGLFLRRIRAEFVERFDRQKGIADARRIARTARQGQSLLFFPEGTFTRPPGLLPFHMGAFVAAAEADVPVVPITMRGTRSILRSENWLPRRGTITVTIGLPVDPKRIRTATMDTWTLAIQLRNAAREDILSHCGEPDLAHETTPI